MQLVKDARLLLPLTEVMKIARLTSLLLDAPHQSLPRLRHGRRLALLFHLNLTLNLCTLFFVLSLALLPPNFANCSSLRKLALVYASYLRSHFSVSQPKALHSRARGYLSEFCRATCPWSLTRLFALLSLPCSTKKLYKNGFTDIQGADKVLGQNIILNLITLKHMH